MILYKDTYAVGNSKKSTDDQRDTEFFEHDFEKICKTDLIQCDSTDDQCCALGTTVSTGIHQHWDEGYKKRDGCECIFISCNDRSCDDGSEHQDQKPWDTVLCMLKNGCFKICLLTRVDGSHLCDILCGLIYHNIHSIVECNNTNHATVLVNNRERKQVILCEQLCNLFLVSVCIHGDDLCLHQVFDRNIVICCHQIFCTYDTDQFSSFCDIAGVNGLFMDSGLLDMCHRLSDSHFLTQVYIFRCHDTSGTVFRIVQQLVDHATV